MLARRADLADQLDRARCRCPARARRWPPARAARRARSRCFDRERRSLGQAAVVGRHASSPSRSASSWATRSTSRRVLTKTSVVRWAATQLRDPVVDVGPLLAGRDRRELLLRNLDGEVEVARAADVHDGAVGRPRRSSRPGPAPTSKRAIVSIGRWVADRPTRIGGGRADASSRSRESARWEPRLSPASAWISSTMTVRTAPSSCRPALRRSAAGRATRGW